MLLKLPYESEKAKQLNREIFETIYYHSMCMSMEISKKREEIIQQLDTKNYDINLNEYEVELQTYKGAYSSFDGSPL